jgi:hypothetical protein
MLWKLQTDVDHDDFRLDSAGLEKCLDSVGRRIDVEAQARAVIRKQPQDRRIVIRDEHFRRPIAWSKFDRARHHFNIRPFNFQSGLLHDVAPVFDCRLRVSRSTGISTSIRPQMN